jgi:hypothetical protein
MAEGSLILFLGIPCGMTTAGLPIAGGMQSRWSTYHNFDHHVICQNLPRRPFKVGFCFIPKTM